MKKLITILFAALLATACGGGDSEGTGNEGTGSHGVPGNINANIGIAKHATRIEVPALRDGELFIAHTTTVNHKENVTYSISHNAE